MRAATLGISSVLAAATAITISLYATAHAQATVQAGPPPAGPRGITGSQEVQQPTAQQRLNPGQFGGGGGGGGIAADQGVVYILRGNVLFAVSGASNGGRMRVLDQIELPVPNRGQNPFRQGGQPPRAGGQQGGNGTPPPPSK